MSIEQTLNSNPDDNQKDVENANEPQATQDEVLEFVKQALNRDFTSREEALKSLKNLNSLVGEQTIARQRELAEITSSVIQKIMKEEGLSEEEAKDYLRSFNPTFSEDTNLKDDLALKKVKSIEEKIYTQELLEKYPEAKKNLSALLEDFRLTGLHPIEIFEKKYKPFIDDLVAQEEKKHLTINTPKGFKPLETDKSKEALSKYMASNYKDKNALKEAIKHRIAKRFIEEE